MKKLPKTFIIHVSDDHVREKHVLSQLQGTISDFEFVNDGDIADLNQGILEEYFAKSLHDMSKPNEISCTYKHFLVYEYMIQNNLKECLILEDDIILYPNFSKEIELIRQEIEEREISRYMISLEDSTNQFIKRSERKKGQRLYKKDRGRLTGAYLVDLPAAQDFLDFVKENKCDRLIDNYQTYSARHDVFDFYWCLNAVATQGSKNGLLASHIAKPREGMLRRIGVKVHQAYKKLLYEFR